MDGGRSWLLLLLRARYMGGGYMRVHYMGCVFIQARACHTSIYGIRYARVGPSNDGQQQQQVDAVFSSMFACPRATCPGCASRAKRSS